MIVTVIGKREVDRISKRTGKYVNGCVIHAKYLDEGVVGEAVKSYWADEVYYKPHAIRVGQQYVLDARGCYVVKFRPALKVEKQRRRLLKIIGAMVISKKIMTN